MSMNTSKLTRWFVLSWWSYLFGGMKHVRYTDERFWRLRVVLCRMRGHPAGAVWYSSGFEPDMTCKNCGEDLG